MTDEHLFVLDAGMGERRSNRGRDRTEEEIRAHPADMDLLRRIAQGSVTNAPEMRMDLRRLAREDLIVVGFATGSEARIMPRGERLLAQL